MQSHDYRDEENIQAIQMEDMVMPADQATEKDMEKLDIIHLFGKEKLENIQRKLSKATGLAFVTVDYRGEPITECTYFTKFCQAVRSNPDAVTQCKSSDAFGSIQAAVTQKPSVYYCPCGLLEVAIPIIFKNQYMGGFIGGQIRCHDAPEGTTQLEKVIQRNQEQQYNEEQEKLMEEIPAYSYEKFLDMVNLVFLIINQLSASEIRGRAEKEELKKQIAKLELLQKKQQIKLGEQLLETSNLKARFNPYILMDMLTTAANQAIIESAEQTSRVLDKLSDIVRYQLLEQEKKVRLEVELENLEHYLEVQKQKYGDKLEYSIQIPNGMRTQKIPSHVILPFVEHAVFFGMQQTKGVLKVTIIGFYQGDNVVLRIEDNGLGMSSEKIMEKYSYLNHNYEGYYIQLAMDVAREKMREVYGEQQDIRTENEAGFGNVSVIYWPEYFEERIE
ncbi:MAG: PocR ligand-binding domain-containing protein [Hespellia sp.]|nr:PocR ligand-binding domain-containing protein [Hespellia sp.]